MANALRSLRCKWEVRHFHPISYKDLLNCNPKIVANQILYILLYLEFLPVSPSEGRKVICGRTSYNILNSMSRKTDQEQTVKT